MNLRKSKKEVGLRYGKTLLIGNMVFFMLLFFQSCKREQGIDPEIDRIPVEIEVVRFDERFAQATPDSLASLKNEFPYLFPAHYGDSLWLAKMKDTLSLELNQETLKAFPDFKAEKQGLKSLYKHILYYNPQTPIPKVVTVVSEVDYQNKVILTDTILLVALDTYLGSDHRFYDGIQKFIRQDFEPGQLDVDVAFAFAKAKLGPRKGRRFIDELVYQGKRLYMMQRLLSGRDENAIIRYTPEQLVWAEENEAEIWTYFVERKLLFDTDEKLLQRFINPGPFSKFYMDFDDESPPRIGQYIGWQMVRAYMKNNRVPLQELPGKTTDEIFKNSTYKPRK